MWLEIVAFDPDTAASLPTFTDIEISSHAADTNAAVVVFASTAAHTFGEDCPATFSNVILFKNASYSPVLCV